MLTDYIKKKRRGASTKINNIEEIQGTIKSIVKDYSCDKLTGRSDLGAEYERVQIDQIFSNQLLKHTPSSDNKLNSPSVDIAAETLFSRNEKNNKKILLRSSVKTLNRHIKGEKQTYSEQLKTTNHISSNKDKNKDEVFNTSIRRLEDYSFISETSDISQVSTRKLTKKGTKVTNLVLEDNSLNTSSSIKSKVPEDDTKLMNSKKTSSKNDTVLFNTCNKVPDIFDCKYSESSILDHKPHALSEITEYLTNTETEIEALNFKDYQQLASIRETPSNQSDVLQEKPFDFELKDQSLDLKKIKINNHATRRINISYSLASTYLNFPRSFKEVSTLYKIIETVVEFNKRRGQTVIFSKYVDSLERMFKHRIEIQMLEKINFICKNSVSFIPLSVSEEGANVKTFMIDILNKVDVDRLLFNNLIEKYEGWLLENKIDGKIVRFHPDFLNSKIDIERKPFLPAEKPICEKLDIKKIAKAKSNDILERIKEKERLRKEQFIKECTKSVNYLELIDDIFRLADKKAIELDDVVFKIGGYDCRSNVLKSIDGVYEVRTIKGTEYLLKIK